MPGHWLLVVPHGHRVRRDTIAPKGLTSRTSRRLELGRRSIVAGSIRIDGNLVAEPFARINGDVYTGARCVLGAGVHVTGNIHCGADMHLLPGARIDGDVHCAADLHIHEGVRVVGHLHAGGDLIVEGPAQTGSIACGGRVSTRYKSRHPAPARTPRPPGPGAQSPPKATPNLL